MRILMLNGPPQSGKDEVALQLMTANPSRYTHVKFATPLRKYITDTFGIHDDQIELRKDEVLEHDAPEPFTLRQAMIHHALELKKIWGDGVLGMMAAKELSQMYLQDVIIVTDAGGFEEEYWDFIKELARNEDWDATIDVIVIKLTRDGCSFKGDSRQYFDESAIMGAKDCLQPDVACYKIAVDIIENNGTIDELMMEVADAMSLFHWT